MMVNSQNVLLFIWEKSLKKLNILYKSPTELIPYTNNSRRHSVEQIARIESLITEYGFINPVILNGTIIVAGHARVQAATNLKLPTIPTLDVSYLSKTQIQAYVIADNRSAELSEWDTPILEQEIADLMEQGFDLALVGFEDFKFSENETNEDDTEKDKEFQNKFEVVAECEDETDQEAVFKLLTAKGYKCRILSM